MDDPILLSKAQMRRIEPHFPLSHGIPQVDDRRIVIGIVFGVRNGLHWCDAPAGHGPDKTIYNRFIRWSRLGVFNRIFVALAAKGGRLDHLMIDATHLKAHRTAASLHTTKANRKVPIPHDAALYRQRHKIEIMLGRLKDWRRIHTRYARCAHTFMSAICFAATIIFWF